MAFKNDLALCAALVGFQETKVNNFFFFNTDDNLIKLRRILHILNKEMML